jgi:hypothetical protein
MFIQALVTNRLRAFFPSRLERVLSVSRTARPVSWLKLWVPNPIQIWDVGRLAYSGYCNFRRFLLSRNFLMLSAPRCTACRYTLPPCQLKRENRSKKKNWNEKIQMGLTVHGLRFGHWIEGPYNQTRRQKPRWAVSRGSKPARGAGWVREAEVAISTTSRNQRKPGQLIDWSVQFVVSLRRHPIKLERYRED